LKSDDFFDTQRYPVAEFQLLRITALPNARLGTPSHEVAGELTLKGVTGEVTFPAIMGPTADGLLAADAHFDIDRTRWGALYGSGKFYEKLGQHLVSDEVSLALKIITLPSRSPNSTGSDA
jgi:polyisoprenoid-binding protein YceI